MFEIKDLTIKVNDRFLIENLSLTLNKGDKLAIIGEEGNGKSTILKSILDLCDYAEVSGMINFKNNKVGYLEQSVNDKDIIKTGYYYLFTSDEDYYSKINDFYKYLEVMNLDDSILNQTLNTLSGGEKVKISILKLLLEENDILFLDEPTNDLDIETLEWLENFINKTDKPIMYVSHDEVLLSKTANYILHLEQIKKKTESHYTCIKMTYDEYIKNRLYAIDKQTRIAKSEKREFNKKHERLMSIMQSVEHQQNTISRANPHGAQVLKKKMHSLKSQEKKLDNTNLTEVPDVEEEINFFFDDVFIPRNKIILQLDLPSLEVANKILARDIKLDIIGNTHLCIVGRNGSGKSTLIKMIASKLLKREDIVVGYMPQTYEDILAQYENVLDFISPTKNQEEITKARMYLGNMKFTREEMTGKIKNLSNGTKAKLFLIKLVLDRCNVLILDEPTRNVSPLSNPVIRRVLKEYQGTIISISHDRKYIEEVIDNLYVLTEKGLIKK